jgi:hypothetical protein
MLRLILIPCGDFNRFAMRLIKVIYVLWG